MSSVAKTEDMIIAKSISKRSRVPSIILEHLLSCLFPTESRAKRHGVAKENRGGVTISLGYDVVKTTVPCSASCGP